MERGGGKAASLGELVAGIFSCFLPSFPHLPFFPFRVFPSFLSTLLSPFFLPRRRSSSAFSYGSPGRIIAFFSSRVKRTAPAHPSLKQKKSINGQRHSPCHCSSLPRLVGSLMTSGGGPNQLPEKLDWSFKSQRSKAGISMKHLISARVINANVLAASLTVSVFVQPFSLLFHAR